MRGSWLRLCSSPQIVSDAVDSALSHSAVGSALTRAGPSVHDNGFRAPLTASSWLQEFMPAPAPGSGSFAGNRHVVSATVSSRSVSWQFGMASGVCSSPFTGAAAAGRLSPKHAASSPCCAKRAPRRSYLHACDTRPRRTTRTCRLAPVTAASTPTSASVSVRPGLAEPRLAPHFSPEICHRPFCD